MAARRLSLWLAVASGLSMAITHNAFAAAASNARAASSLRADFSFIQQQLSHPAEVKFSSTLQDSADENNTAELEFTVAVDDATADAGQCRLSYHQRVERDGVASEQQVQLSLREISDVVVEPFEKYQNEWETRSGFVYVMTDPSITAVVLVGPKHSANWLAFTDASVAAQIGAAFKRAVSLCSPARS